jgi:hypothetical protein
MPTLPGYRAVIIRAKRLGRGYKPRPASPQQKILMREQAVGSVQQRETDHD